MNTRFIIVTVFVFSLIGCTVKKEEEFNIISTPDVSTLGVVHPVVGYTYEYYFDEEVDKDETSYFEYNDNNQMESLQYGSYWLQHNPLAFYSNNSIIEHDFSFNEMGCATSFVKYSHRYEMKYDENNHLISLLCDWPYGADFTFQWNKDGSLEFARLYTDSDRQTCITMQFSYSKKKLNTDGIYLSELVAKNMYLPNYISDYLFFSGLLGTPSKYLPDSFSFRENYDYYGDGEFSYIEENGHIYQVVYQDCFFITDTYFYSGAVYTYRYKGLHHLFPK